MIAPIREVCERDELEHQSLSEAARLAAASLLPPRRTSDSPASVPAWQAWLLVAWLVTTSIAYVAITLGLWTR